MLSFRTRQLVEKLLAGEHIVVGDLTFGPLEEAEKAALKEVSEHLGELGPRSAAERAEFLLNATKEKVEQSGEPGTPVVHGGASEGLRGLRLGRIRACSFRGLAPNGEEWKFDFAGESHLLFGPNGSGKSSLMGAISWCLTERVFRDDCPPQTAENVATYTAGDSSRKGATWPDAATLPPSGIRFSECEPTYWVALELVGKDAQGNTKRIWLRRHNNEGLGCSANGEEPWKSIDSLAEVGIDELDVELCVLMPARAAHLHFGKDPQLLRVFAQLVGLDDLEHIADVAGSACSQLRAHATKQLKEVGELEDSVGETVQGVRSSAPPSVSRLAEFSEATTERPSLTQIESLGHKVKELKDQVDRQLGSELGLPLPEGGKPLDAATKKLLDDLPGKVSTAYDRLSGALSETFPQTLAFSEVDAQIARDLESKLAEFGKTARCRIEERIEWAKAEQSDRRAPLLLEAAKYFPEGSTQCPVCDKDIKGEPVADRLDKLRPLADRPHLRRKAEELATDLLRELDKIVAPDMREKGTPQLADRLLSDWEVFKKNYMQGPLGSPAVQPDKEMRVLAGELRNRKCQAAEPLVDGRWPLEYRQALAEVEIAWRGGHAYVDLLHASHEQSKTISKRLEAVLREPAGQGTPSSLRARLAKAHELAVSAKPLAETRSYLETAYKQRKKADEERQQAEQRQSLAEALEQIKGLSGLVRAEVRCIVGEVSSEMESLYNKLYEDEHLGFGMLTPGHPANPDVHDQLNLYLKRGDTLVPFNPFTNAGRSRALVLALVFALMKKRQGSLAFVLQDDPVTSLDDEHRARFVDRFVHPMLEAEQVVLATHYETFYEAAEPTFATAQNLRLTPRRGEGDKVDFEPSHLLERVKRALEKPDCSWRSEAGNLRIWVERALGAISSYCPKPFVVKDNLVDTIKAYQREMDPQIATTKRDHIVRILTSMPVNRVLNKLHHNHSINQPDVEDALTELEICRKDVFVEIKRLRALWKHRSTGRPLGPLEPRSIPFALRPEIEIPDARLQVVGSAAAAAQGQPIDLTEQTRVRLVAVSPLLVKVSTLSPVALPGQFVLVAGQDTACTNGDLVAARTEEKGSYLRRFWQVGDEIVLENTNPTDHVAPICVAAARCCARRIVGVVFDGLRNVGLGGEGYEWAVPDGAPSIELGSLLGVRVHGHSMEPIALEGQIVLLKRFTDPRAVARGTLACIELAEGGAVLKRCYPGRDNWTLLSINPTSPEEPMLVKARDVRSVFVQAGVLFDTAILSED